MKAAVLEAVKTINLRDVPTPKITGSSVLVRVRACGICGSDMKFYNYGDRVSKFPQILGHENAGEVVEIGPKVDNFSVGDRLAIANEIPCKSCYACRIGLENVCENIRGIVGVSIPGGFAEFMLLDETLLRDGPVNRMPSGLTFEEGALAEPLGCVVNGFEFAHMNEGKEVFIIGTGPIGCLMISLARLLGASRITVADMNPKRLDMARQFGADNYIYANGDYIKEAVKLTSGKGYDVVMSACNSSAAHQNAILASAKGGFVNLFGGVAKGLPDTISFSNNFIHYRQSIIGGSFSQTKQHHKRALDYLATGEFKADKIVTHKFPLEKTLEAFGVVERCEGLKVMINP